MTSAPATTHNEQPTTNHFVRLFLSEYLVLGLTVLLFVALVPFTPGLATGANLLNILGYLLPLLVVAIGMTLVMITGGIDLSVTSIIALTSVVGAKLMTNDGGGTTTAIGVMVMLALGAGLGALNGAVITLLRLPAFIVTLASMMFLSGFAVWLTQSKNIYGLPESFLALGQRLPIALGITAALAVAAHLMLRRTVYGRWLYATGQNATAAHISGVPVRTMTFAAYVASGFCAALASVMLTGRLETGSPVLGREILLDIIGATVVGGTSLFGGKGKIVWTLFGVLFLTVLDNALNLLSLSQFSITMPQGRGHPFRRRARRHPAATLPTERMRDSRTRPSGCCGSRRATPVLSSREPRDAAQSFGGHRDWKFLGPLCPSELCAEKPCCQTGDRSCSD